MQDCSALREGQPAKTGIVRSCSLLSSFFFAACLLWGAAVVGAEAQPGLPSTNSGEAAGLLKRTAEAANSRDWPLLLNILLEVHLNRKMEEKDRIVFLQGTLIAVENLCMGEGDDLGSRQPLQVAFLAGKYSGRAQRHLHLAESTELTPVGWGARLAAESAASYYFLGRLIEMERADPADLDEDPSRWLTRRHVLQMVYFAASLRHWLGLDARLTAEVAAVLDAWLASLAREEISLSFDYLRDLATSPGLRDASVPGDAPVFYRSGESVNAGIVNIIRRKPEALIIMAAAERYAYPEGFRWLEPAGLAMEHLKEAGGLDALDNIQEQLSGVRAVSRPDLQRRKEFVPHQAPRDG